VLVVTAHPDDEAMFAATMYRITHALGGTVDLALVTDGAGGYRFSTFAEPIYGLELTDESIARQYLPAIRKQELMAGGKIVGIRDYFFLDQPDQGKTENADSVMKYVWDTDEVAGRLDDILAEGDYDYVFTHLPIKPFHAHHKAATILALEAVRRMEPSERPIILGSFTTGGMDDVVKAFVELEGHPITRIRKTPGPFTFDRGTRLGLDDRLNYTIVVNWLIAEHKSQGTMQMFMSSEPSTERFWLYELNPSEAAAETEALFQRIRTAPIP
jgi:LmbE family N-acetylglucosaminyl deacetylase